MYVIYRLRRYLNDSLCVDIRLIHPRDNRMSTESSEEVPIEPVTIETALAFIATLYVCHFLSFPLAMSSM